MVATSGVVAASAALLSLSSLLYGIGSYAGSWGDRTLLGDGMGRRLVVVGGAAVDGELSGSDTKIGRDWAGDVDQSQAYQPLAVDCSCPAVVCDCTPEVSCHCDLPTAKVGAISVDKPYSLFVEPLFCFSWLGWSIFCVLCGCCRPQRMFVGSERILQYRAGSPPSQALSPPRIKTPEFARRELFKDARDVSGSPGSRAADLRALPRRGRLA